MLAASHAIVGAAIAANTQNPLLGYTIAVVSHPLLDLVPHWDFNIRHNNRSPLSTIVISALDAGVGFGLGFLIFGGEAAPGILFLTMLLAQLPDWIEAPYHIFKWNFPPFSSIKQFQHRVHSKLAPPWGILTQVVFLTVLILFVTS